MGQVTTRIVGAQHHEGAQTALNTLRRNTDIHLVREPDNAYDANAISCWYAGQMLGYIPKKDNTQAAAAMDRREPVTCRIYPTQPMVLLAWPSTVDLAEATKLRRIVRGA